MRTFLFEILLYLLLHSLILMAQLNIQLLLLVGFVVVFLVRMSHTPQEI